MIYNQAGFDVRCEWGEEGLAELAPDSDVIVIVDVMSFSTCVSVAVSHGAVVYPYRFDRENAARFAASIGGIAAQARAGNIYSLSPASLLTVQSGMKLVLPSRNGSHLSTLARGMSCFAGSLRNARSVAGAAQLRGDKIAIIPAGERWKGSDRLRPALEDWIGAGAIISYLKGAKSPEATAAENAFRSVEDQLLKTLKNCSSGRELASKGFEADVVLIGALNADDVAPVLIDGFYRA